MTSAASASAAEGAAPQGGHCREGTRCYDAGSFTFTIVGATGTVVGGRHHQLRLSAAITNHTDRPLTLAYKSGTNSGLDNLGNAYTWGRPGTHDASVERITANLFRRFLS